jgi:hypothetical protein
MQLFVAKGLGEGLARHYKVSSDSVGGMDLTDSVSMKKLGYVKIK